MAIKRILRFIGGAEYDIFISYYRSDAANYASALADHLTNLNFIVYLDQFVREEGQDELPEKIKKAISYSKMFVILATENCNSSKWMKPELDIYLRRKERNIVPIDFGGIENVNWYEEIKVYQHFEEKNKTALEEGQPSKNITDGIINSFNYKKRNQILQSRALTMITFLALIIVGSILYSRKIVGDAFYERDSALNEKVNYEKIANKNREDALGAIKERDKTRVEIAASKLELESIHTKLDSSTLHYNALKIAKQAEIEYDGDPTRGLITALNAYSIEPNQIAEKLLIKSFNSKYDFYTAQIPNVAEFSINKEGESIAYVDLKGRLNKFNIIKGKTSFIGSGKIYKNAFSITNEMLAGTSGTDLDLFFNGVKKLTLKNSFFYTGSYLNSDNLHLLAVLGWEELYLVNTQNWSYKQISLRSLRSLYPTETPFIFKNIAFSPLSGNIIIDYPNYVFVLNKSGDLLYSKPKNTETKELFFFVDDKITSVWINKDSLILQTYLKGNTSAKYYVNDKNFDGKVKELRYINNTIYLLLDRVGYVYSIKDILEQKKSWKIFLRFKDEDFISFPYLDESNGILGIEGKEGLALIDVNGERNGICKIMDPVSGNTNISNFNYIPSKKLLFTLDHTHSIRIWNIENRHNKANILKLCLHNLYKPKWTLVEYRKYGEEPVAIFKHIDGSLLYIPIITINKIIAEKQCADVFVTNDGECILLNIEMIRRYFRRFVNN